MSADTTSNEVERIPVKEAIRMAKSILSDFLEGEVYSHLGLEGVHYEPRNNQWVVTLGFNRPWEVEKEVRNSALYAAPATVQKPLRTYKKIKIEGATGNFVAMDD